MILLDANLLVYAYNQGSEEHERARQWLEQRLAGPARVGLPWATLLAFVRLAANPRVFAKPTTVANAWQQVERWLEAPTAWIPPPTHRHRDVLGGLLASVSSANLVPDAHLAALAIEHGLTLCSNDGDFARFADLRWEDPLAGSADG